MRHVALLYYWSALIKQHAGVRKHLKWCISQAFSKVCKCSSSPNDIQHVYFVCFCFVESYVCTFARTTNGDEINIKHDTWIRVNILQWVNHLLEKRVPGYLHSVWSFFNSGRVHHFDKLATSIASTRKVCVYHLTSYSVYRETTWKRRQRPVHAACHRSGKVSVAGRGFPWARNTWSSGQNLRRQAVSWSC